MSTSASLPNSTRTLTFALVGNPNCGKTTLFNALTGMRQKVGNYPGVTVEKKVGSFFSAHGEPMQLIDLPGAYSLSPRSPDETITRDVLLGRMSETKRPDRVVCVVDASNLERNLFLVSQVIDLGLPVILALNMVDVARSRGMAVDPQALSRELGMPVIACQANEKIGVIELRQAMSRAEIPVPPRRWSLPSGVAEPVDQLAQCLARHRKIDSNPAFTEALMYMTGELSWNDAGLPPECRTVIETCRHHLKQSALDPQEAVVAARYEHIQKLCERVVRSSGDAESDLTDRLDAVFTHRIWGWLVFLGMMGLMFFSIFTLAAYPMDWIESGFSKTADGIRQAMPAGDLRDLLTDGVLAGVGGVLVFLPQIVILFFFIGLLEDTGYMARAAFIMDRVMSRVGLHGKSFIPLLSSYACAIPGIMATRTIENPKDRLVTILVAPLMSCSARLPVYTVMIATLLPVENLTALKRAAIMLALYAFGTGAAFVFAWLFKSTIMRGETPMLIMELPPYRRPALRSIVMQMIGRSTLFVKRAGTVILGLSILLWFLAAYPKTDAGAQSTQLAQSYAGRMGHLLEPLIEPLGFDWKIGIGLVGSFAAREVFVSTMSIVYNVAEADDVTVPLSDAMRQAKWPDGTTVYTTATCISLLVFYVLAMQCISTIAVVKRETNSWRWPLFQLAYMTGSAYVLSFTVFQTARLFGL